MVELSKPDWWKDLKPRGKTTVSMMTVIPRDPDARELAAIGEWLYANEKIKTNNSYNVTQYALTALRGAMRAYLKGQR